MSKRTPRKTDRKRRHRIDPTTLDLKGLGEEPDRVVAARNGVSIGTIFQIRRRMKIDSARKKAASVVKAAVDAQAARFGVDSDADIARDLGVHVDVVQSARLSLGIKLPTGGVSPKNIDWSAQPLGKVPDAKIAAALGVSRQRVFQVRKARGIALEYGQP